MEFCYLLLIVFFYVEQVPTPENGEILYFMFLWNNKEQQKDCYSPVIGYTLVDFACLMSQAPESQYDK